LRDQDLIEFGIKIEDRDQMKSIWKFSDKEKLLKEQEEKVKAKQLKEQEKQRKLEAEKKQAEIDPATMFFNEPLYGTFDEEGIPTHNKEGKELNKKLINKLKKEQEK
jgi:cysteinyl-tRNA synthetase